mmetsp:Transcript_9672/g.29499  ORF Transcript_9672/g.29499 Transcript_9672/m.29499 type:complete len:224 (+) Transcript_9672:1638-2309(+)
MLRPACPMAWLMLPPLMNPFPTLRLRTICSSCRAVGRASQATPSAAQMGSLAASLVLNALGFPKTCACCGRARQPQYVREAMERKSHCPLARISRPSSGLKCRKLVPRRRQLGLREVGGRAVRMAGAPAPPRNDRPPPMMPRPLRWLPLCPLAAPPPLTVEVPRWGCQLLWPSPLTLSTCTPSILMPFGEIYISGASCPPLLHLGHPMRPNASTLTTLHPWIA